MKQTEMEYLNRFLLFLFICLSFPLLFSQTQEEILEDLREDNSYKTETSQYSFLEKLRSIYKNVKSDLENKEDKNAIQHANELEKLGITSDKFSFRGKSELGEMETLYLKIRKLRGEAFYNLRDFKNALSDSKFIVENHPKSVVFDYTRYAVSLYYSGEERQARKILNQAKAKFKNSNDQEILNKTLQLLFPNG
ncbi:MAG TPA: hypothetical protein PK079_20575 [Leptospiraceae bacterium]|nr:hypothetical protein [Leptospiraceae bacterium]HNE55578.1 hypothetical protein [Leptospiraceae bacterium]